MRKPVPQPITTNHFFLMLLYLGIAIWQSLLGLASPSTCDLCLRTTKLDQRAQGFLQLMLNRIALWLAVLDCIALWLAVLDCIARSLERMDR